MILHDERGASKQSRGLELAFCTLWTTGPDTSLDGVFRIQVLKHDGDSWERYDRFCRPFEAEPGSEDEGATSRMQREYGVTREHIEAAPHARDLWPELVEFVGSRPLLVLDVESFGTWFGALAPRGTVRPRMLGLIELAALLFPGRLSNRREGLVEALVGAPRPETPRAFGPVELIAATSELFRRFLEGDSRAHEFAAVGYRNALRGLEATDPDAAATLELALQLLDSPSSWRRVADGRLPLAGPLPEGRLQEVWERAPRAGTLLSGSEPRCAEEGRKWGEFKPLPPEDEDAGPLDELEQRTLDDVFQVHLPALANSKLGYRESQHRVSTEVGDVLGSGELLLVHAPTGTGKTLAYLVPTLLWASQRELRVGVATYTRALQEQALDREVPLALAALARAGVTRPMRVSLLKGRENYLCWRALRLHLPTDDDDGERWLAWTSLMLFALGDLDGDLDRFPLRAPIALERGGEYQALLAQLVRLVRARVGCCSLSKDRATCAAEVARRKAERSHVVITNHSFALSRQEFFRHVVFDECEHLHDQAHSAWSHTLRFQTVRNLLDRLHQPREPHSRAVLDRLVTKLTPTTQSHRSLDEASQAWTATCSTLAGLERAADSFLRWRESHAHDRGPADEHSLYREFAASPEGATLIDARLRFHAAANELEGALAELQEHLDALHLRGVGRIRYGLELTRTGFSDVLAAVEAWLPLRDGQPDFRARTFYDIEVGRRGEVVLAARVLLPNEYLGRNYYPQLASAAFLSATTWLRGGFEAAAGYLGLDRVANPGEDEERAPRVVREFRAPDVFDYGRVMVAVPRDAPAPSLDKHVFLDYVRRFVMHLAERTRGRMLVLFTNAKDVVSTGEALEGAFRARRIPLWYQGMRGAAKEELSELFRARVDSVLLGVDTFWYGADFPGETLEYLVIVRLPYGVPDRYHHAQCAALGQAGQRARIYLPRALAKLRQGFGRLMRKESDRGCVFLLDGRVLQPRHRAFLAELPLRNEFLAEDADELEGKATFVRGETDLCIQRALAHMGMLSDVRRRQLTESFDPDALPSQARELRAPVLPEALRDVPDEEFQPQDERMDLSSEDLPF